MPRKREDGLKIFLLRSLRRIIRFVFIVKTRTFKRISIFFRPNPNKACKAMWQPDPRQDLVAILSGRLRLDLHPQGTPRVTLVIPVFNRAELTASCLRALAAATEGVAIEVIIVDNASSDETGELLKHINGLRVIRNAVNQHFIKAVNQGAKEAHGQYLLILNNDTEIAPDSIRNAVSLMDKNPEYGAVGGRIVHIDGSLQEAGSIIWSNGSCVGYGRGDDPDNYRFQFRRYVDYCSGVFLLTPLERFRSLDGFDERFCPAYYEEVDYCVRLWKAGYPVVYEPTVVVKHHEFASSRRREDALSLQARNRKTFISIHSDWLRLQHAPAKDLTRPRRRLNPGAHRVLVVDDQIPHTWLGAGLPRANRMLHLILELGCEVSFFPMTISGTPQWSKHYEDISREIEIVWPDKFLDHWKERPGYYDTLIVSRPHNLRRLRESGLDDVLGDTRLVYDAEALFANRTILQAEVLGTPLSKTEQDELFATEINIAHLAEVITTVSAAEGNHFRIRGHSHVEVLGHPLSPAPAPEALDTRIGLLFVGSLAELNSPNTDSIQWFVQEVLPRLEERLGRRVPLEVAGICNPKLAEQLIHPSVRLHGRVMDLTELYGSTRVFVAPTRFAAGIPLKVLEAAAAGIPIVATDLLVKQLGWVDGRDLLASPPEPAPFVEAIARIYENDALWKSLRESALKRIIEDCSEARFKESLARALGIDYAAKSSFNDCLINISETYRAGSQAGNQ